MKFKTLAQFKAEFPALSKPVNGKRLVYLDSACTALKSKAVIKATNDFYTNLGVCGGKRSTHSLSQKTEELLSRVRQKSAEFINAASANEIVFTSGTTEAMNLLARAFPFDETRSEVVITELEHNAVFLPFYELAQEKKILLKICPAPDGVVDLNALERLITAKTALLAMTHASNVYGGVTPIYEAARLAHKNGALIALDNAQHAASHSEDVQASNVDFAAFSAHKIGGPFGVGVLYGKEHLLNRLNRFKVGGGTLKSLDAQKLEVRYLDAPYRFEAGVGNYAGIAGLEAALDLISSVGYPALRSHARKLVSFALTGLEKIEEIRILGLGENIQEGSLISFVFNDSRISAADFSLYLNREIPKHTLALRTGEHCAHLLNARHNIKESVRISFFGYNEKEDAAVFLKALNSFLAARRRNKKEAAL